VLHPDILLEQLTAEQIIEWRAAYDHAPWGELRADMRGVAHAAMSMGQRGLRPTWPYVETLDMIEQEFVEIAKQTGEDPERVRELMRRHRGRDSS
jgi:hypothetical protein